MNKMNWKMFNFSQVGKLKDEKRGRGNPGHHFDFQYLSGIHGFDLEDSKVKINDKFHGLVYLWSIRVCNTNIYGRRIEEIQQCFETLCEHIPDGKRLVVWVYNLSHEFQFIKDFFDISEVFCPEVRQPIRAVVNDKIELRCAWYLMGKKKTLDDVCVEMGIGRKLQGYDHEVFRTPDTELSEFDLDYNITDTQLLCECVEQKLKKCNDNLYTVPFTSTGYTREKVKKVRRELPWLSTLKPNFETHEKLEFVNNGGVAMSNKRKTCQLINNVQYWDMVSAYIFALCCLQFPMRPFKTFNQEVNGKFDKTEIERFERLGRCWFAKVRLLNVKIKKDRFMEYIPEGKCTQKLNAVSNCGRIISADFLELWITDIDWNIINDTYDFDDYFEFDDVNYSKYGKLPEELTTLLKNLFADKTILKGCSDKSLYDHAKALLNAVYGIMVQSLTRRQAVFEEGEGFKSIDMHNEESYKNKKMLLPYQWGVWTTAHTRNLLFEAVKICGRSIVSIDTDCVIFEENEAVEAKLNGLNEQRIEIAKNNLAYASDRNGRVHYMGLFEHDKTFEEFKTLGPKMYCGKVDGEIQLTCSGVNKKKGSQCIKSVDDFDDGFEFDESCAHTSTYVDVKPFKWNGFTIGSSVVIEPYKFKIDLEKYITLEEYHETKNKIKY